MNMSAVLLAGGESRRMGKDKATLQFRGRPLWQIQFELLRKLHPSEIFISARTDPTWRNKYLRSEEHTSELQSHSDLVCRLLLEKKKYVESEVMSWIGAVPADLAAFAA